MISEFAAREGVIAYESARPQSRTGSSMVTVIQPAVPHARTGPQLLFSCPFNDPSTVSVADGRLTRLPRKICLGSDLVSFSLYCAVRRLTTDVHRAARVFDSFFCQGLSQGTSAGRSLAGVGVFRGACYLIPVGRRC